MTELITDNYAESITAVGLDGQLLCSKRYVAMMPTNTKITAF
jgi:hypothetical protein